MHFKYVPVNNRHFTDINPRQVGHAQCMPGEYCNQSKNDFTLIHYVSYGKGILYKNNFYYEVSAGEAFIILPGESATYKADKTTPWRYHWIAFDGVLSEKFKSLPPVFVAPGSIFAKMEELESNVTVREFHLAARIFDLYAALFSETPIINPHVRNTEKILCENFGSSKLRISDVAKKIGIDRKYLATLYKNETGMTMQERLCNIRVNYAKELFQLGTSVSNAAELCGYETVDNFAKIFKKKTGLSPTEFKNNLKKK